eukprot:8930159-Alexandrium_andersonii.AAC.1
MSSASADVGNSALSARAWPTGAVGVACRSEQPKRSVRPTYLLRKFCQPSAGRPTSRCGWQSPALRTTAA